MRVVRPISLFHSVRGRLVLLVLSLVAPALLLVAGLIHRAYANERVAVARELLGTTRAVAAVIDREMEEADAILKTIAASHALARDDFAAVDALARKALANDHRWFVLGDARYEQLVNTLVPYGTRVPAIPEDAELRDAMTRGATYISNLMQGPVAGALVMHVSRPVHVDGRIKYTLHLTARPAGLADALGVHRYAPANLVSIVDRNGRIVVRTRDAEKFVGQHASPGMAAFYNSETEGVRDTVTLDGVPSLTAFHRAPVSGWVAIIAAPKAQLLASARQLLWIGLGLSAVLLLVAGGIAAWIARSLAHGVDTLVAGSEVIARGEPLRVEPSGLRETDFIAEAMARSAGQQRLISAQLETALAQEKAARTQAQHSAERLSFSLSSLHLGEWDWDVASDRMQISPRTAAIFGLEPRESYTREEIRRTIHPDDVGRARAAARAAVATGTDYHLEYRIDHPTLGLRWIAASGRPLFQSDGRVFAMMGVVQDITERKQAELILRTHNELLDQRVTERTRWFRETNNELEVLSHTLSHDLRPPLQSIQSQAQTLQTQHATRLDEPSLRALALIRASAARLELLARDVLAYTRVAHERIELRPIALDDFVPDLVPQLPAAQAPGVTVDIQRPLPSALGHEAYLAQVFTNLLANALKFVPPGAAPHVEISARSHNGTVRLAVRDNGIGIDPADHQRIFEMFNRVGDRGRDGGAGIGLAIARKAVQRMGGEIGVESSPGRGSTFWFTLRRPH